MKIQKMKNEESENEEWRMKNEEFAAALLRKWKVKSEKSKFPDAL